MKIRHGMNYRKGDIVLIKFPFTNLQEAKKRPVLLLKDANSMGDFVCLQITSKKTQHTLLQVDKKALKTGELKLLSFVKYDKCFTLNTEIVDKKLASVNNTFMSELHALFCEELF